MLTLGILREIHTKSVYFVLDYTQAGVKSEIFMELPMDFGVGGAQPREWVIRLEKTSMAKRIQNQDFWIKSSKVWRLDILSNNKCIHFYSIKKKWSYSFMLIIA